MPYKQAFSDHRIIGSPSNPAVLATYLLGHPTVRNDDGPRTARGNPVRAPDEKL